MSKDLHLCSCLPWGGDGLGSLGRLRELNICRMVLGATHIIHVPWGKLRWVMLAALPLLLRSS